MKHKLFFSILFVTVIIAIAFGGTYAYYLSMSESDIGGSGKEGISTELNLEVIHNASSRLVPLYDNLVQTAVSKSSNPCIDNSKYGYNVCSLYKITLTNEGNSENLYGYVKTTTSTYETDNLKYQVFDSSYNALTDAIVLSRVANESVYFKKNSNNIGVTSSGNTSYYLAIWLSDTGLEQSADYLKTFNGSVGFELIENFGTNSKQIEATFNT